MSEEQANAEQAQNLSVQDLLLLAQVIQVAANRGAIKAEEMTNVGAVYNKLIAFLQATGAIQAPEETNKEEE